MAEEKQERWQPFHKVAMEMFRKEPHLHAHTICAMFEQGVKVPPEAIPGIVEYLRDAIGSIISPTTGQRALEALELQLAEAKEKGESMDEEHKEKS